MAPRLPPPDPHESVDLGPGIEISAPVVVFAAGPPSSEVDRLSDAIVDFRPGALFVLIRE